MSQPATLLQHPTSDTEPSTEAPRSGYPRATYLDSRRAHPSAKDGARPDRAYTASPAGGVDLRAAFRGAAASTWVITAAGETGPVGFTAISVASVSVTPPLVSFNLSKNSSSLVTLARSGSAALHLLADGQESLARRFAGDRALRFGVDDTWQYDDHGLPRVNDVAARLVTQLVDLVDTGDSFLAVSRVLHTLTSERSPLVHFRGSYHPAPAAD